MVVVLDLRVHEAVVEHSGGRTARVPLTPHRPVGAVTRDVLAAVRDLGGPVQIDPTPQEVPWQVPLDADEEHARYDPGQVDSYFAAATMAAQVLAAYRAPYRGAPPRSTPGGGPSTWRSACSPGCRPNPLRMTSSCATRATPSRSRSAGGRATAGTAGRPSSRTPTRPRPASTARPCPAGAGMARWGSTSWTGTTSGPRTTLRHRAGVRPFGLPARVRRVRVGRGAGRQRRRNPAAGRLALAAARRTPLRLAARPPRAARRPGAGRPPIDGRTGR